MPDPDFERLLATTATSSERVRGLLALGITTATLADITRCSESATRNWKSGQAEPRADAAMVIDDLRITALVLLRAGLEPERAANWLTSRDPDHFGAMRPIEMIRIDPMEVLAAAHETVLGLVHQPA